MFEVTSRVSGLRPARIEAFKRSGAPLRSLIISGIKDFFLSKSRPVTVQEIDGKIRFIFVNKVNRKKGEKISAQLKEFIGKQPRLARNITISVEREALITHIEVSFKPAQTKPVDHPLVKQLDADMEYVPGLPNDNSLVKQLDADMEYILIRTRY